MQDYKKLKVWEKSHALTLKIYIETKNFPKEELYGLISQLRRSASSIPTNIAEGCGRYGKKELCRFLQISMGSASEVEYHLLLSFELKYFTKKIYNELLNDIIEIKQMLTSFIKKLNTDN